MARPPSTGVMPTELAAGIDQSGAGRAQFIGEPREEALDDAQAAHEHGVEVAALRHARARLGMAVDGIAFDQRHTVEVFGQNSRGKQARNTCACDDGVPERTIGMGTGLAICHGGPLGVRRSWGAMPAN